MNKAVVSRQIVHTLASDDFWLGVLVESHKILSSVLVGGSGVSLR